MNINVKMIALITLMLGLVNCTIKQDRTDQLLFTGTLKGYGDGIINLLYNDPNEIMKDSIVVTNDKFEFTRSLNSPRYAFLKIMGNENLKKDYFRIDFFIEASPIDLQFDINDQHNYTITGSVSNSEYDKINEQTGTANQTYNKARSELRIKELDPAIRAEIDKNYKEESERYLGVLNKNELFFNSHAGPYKLWLLTRYIPLSDIVQFLPKFNSSLTNNVYLNYMIRKRDAEQRIEPGEMAPDFSLKDLDGNRYSLADFKGNYLIMDFEASWCGPCKLEIPFLMESHEKYADKGLVIVSVNLDKTRELWVKDKITENLPWKMISDLKAFDGPLTKDYSVTSIPRIFLIDPNGKIVSSKIRKEKILEKLEEVYNE